MLNCVIIAYKAINLLKRKQFRGNLVLKVDTKKEFETINWNFLLAEFRLFGFCQVFSNWITNHFTFHTSFYFG